MGRTPAGQTRERIYRFMLDQLRSGTSPTVREVQEHFDFRAVQTAREHLERLVDDGRLDKHAGGPFGKRRARGYKLPGNERPITQVPLLGRVPAGPVDLAVEDLEGHVPFQDGRVHGDENLFALRVHGDSMQDDGIFDGDIAIVRKNARMQNRDIVVALVGEEATIKTLRRFGRRVELHPANPAYTPIVPDPRELTLLGKVIEIRRTL